MYSSSRAPVLTEESRILRFPYVVPDGTTRPESTEPGACQVSFSRASRACGLCAPARPRTSSPSVGASLQNVIPTSHTGWIYTLIKLRSYVSRTQQLATRQVIPGLAFHVCTASERTTSRSAREALRCAPKPELLGVAALHCVHPPWTRHVFPGRRYPDCCDGSFGAIPRPG